MRSSRDSQCRHGSRSALATLLDLTTHFSGLQLMPTNLAPANPENPFGDYTVTQLYEGISGYDLQRDPGDRFEYSNVAVALLGQVLALRAGTTYAALLSDRILRRLGMSHTAVTFTPWMKDHLVRGHDRDGNPVANWDFPTLAGMGGLRSTMNDMLAFAAANLSSEDTDLNLAMRNSHRGLRQIASGCRISRRTLCIQARACWIQLVYLATREAPHQVDRRPYRGVLNLSGAGSRGTARSGRADEHRPEQRRLSRFPPARPYGAAVGGSTVRSFSIDRELHPHSIV